MTTSQLESTWGTVKGKLKQRYGQLTDDDLTFAEGKGEELLSRLQERLGISREELDSALDDLASTAQGKLEEVKAKAGDMVEDLKHRAAVMGDEARAKGEAAYDEARQRARGLWEDGEEYVRANPRESLLVAVAAGFVAGFIFFRR